MGYLPENGESGQEIGLEQFNEEYGPEEGLVRFARKCLIDNLRYTQRSFEEYMTANRWDTCKEDGMYADEGMLAVDMFLEYLETGCVTDDDGKELKA